MTYHAFYLIDPRPELIDHLRKQTDADLACILTEPVLIRNREADRSDWTAEEHTLAVKLLFLARLRGYLPLRSDEDARRLLGSDRIDVELFDRWWLIQRLVLEEDTDQMVTFLRPVLDKVVATGNDAVDHWLNSMHDDA